MQQSHQFPHDSSDLTPQADIEYGVLPNGLRYAVMANATPSNTASLLMRIDTGSMNEADDERGLAHFLEHMAFNGSENLPEGEMIKRLETFGLAFGPDTNASTSFDETIYMLELPEVNDEILNETLMIMRETAGRLTLAEDAIERERGVILSEKRARESPAYHASIASLNYYLKGSLLPERLPIGTEDTIKSITAEQFRAFYEGYYRPENAFIVLVGDFDTGYGAEKISEYFSDWTAVGEAKDNFEPKVLEARGLEAAYYTNPEIQTSIAINVMSEPDLRKDTKANREAYYIKGLGNRILSRRLSRLAQTTDAPFISAGAGSSTAYEIVTLSSLNLSAQPEQWEAALKAGEQELRKAYLYGFTQAELNEQIANTRSALEVAVQTSPTRRTSSLSRRILSNFGGNSVLTSPEDNLALFESYVNDITLEAVYSAFKSGWEGYETPQIYLSTSQVIEDPEAKILEVLAEGQAVEVKPDVQAEMGEFAYTDFGTIGKVVERKTIEDIDFETIRFENNVRLNIKKTPYQKDVISIKASYGKGELFIPNDRLGLRWLITNALTMGGLEAHSADDIQTLMAGKPVGVSFGLGAERISMRGSTTPKYLGDQLNLMVAHLTAPGFRPESKARYEKFIQSYYPTLDSTPAGVASRDIERLIRSGDVRFGIPSEEELLDVTLDNVSDWMADHKTKSAIEIGIVGDVDVESVVAEVARTFGALPSRQSMPDRVEAKVKDLAFPEGSSRPIKLSHSGEPSTALLRIYWPAPDGTDVITARHMNILMKMFKLELTEVLREQSGATYSPSAYGSQSRLYPGYGYAAVSLEVSPADIDKTAAQINQIAEQFQAGDISEDVFERAIKPVLEQIENSLESNSYWMNIIGWAQTDPEQLDRHRNRSDIYESMTLDDIKPLASKVFNSTNAVTYHVLPSE